jgi:hypothetical protein
MKDAYQAAVKGTISTRLELDFGIDMSDAEIDNIVTVVLDLNLKSTQTPEFKEICGVVLRGAPGSPGSQCLIRKAADNAMLPAINIGVSGADRVEETLPSLCRPTFSYLSRDRTKLLQNELDKIEAELETVGLNTQQATLAAVEVLKMIENILREVCLANGLADGSGGVVVQKLNKKGVATTKKLLGMGAYLSECKAIKDHLSSELYGRLQNIRESRNQFSHEPGLFCSVYKGLEFKLLAIQVLKAVSLPTSTLATREPRSRIFPSLFW